MFSTSQGQEIEVTIEHDQDPTDKSSAQFRWTQGEASILSIFLKI